MKVLIVEDSVATRDLLTRSLRDANMEVTSAARLSTGLERAVAEEYDVILLDLGLPDGDGLELCRALRSTGVTTPILCLTARAEVSDRVQGLDAGADDYLKKPFALAELHARIRALARRRGAAPPRVLEAEGLRIDFTGRRLASSGADVPLTEREWRVLELLAARIGQVVDRQEILDLVWHEARPGAADSLDVILSRLRRKLGGPGASLSIRTLRGAGLVLEHRS